MIRKKTGFRNWSFHCMVHNRDGHTYQTKKRQSLKLYMYSDNNVSDGLFSLGCQIFSIFKNRLHELVRIIIVDIISGYA